MQLYDNPGTTSLEISNVYLFLFSSTPVIILPQQLKLDDSLDNETGQTFFICSKISQHFEN